MTNEDARESGSGARVSAQLRRHGARARVRREATRRSIVDDRANDRLRDALRDDERSTDDDDDDAWFPQAHKPTVVTHSAVGKFTSSEATDLNRREEHATGGVSLARGGG